MAKANVVMTVRTPRPDLSIIDIDGEVNSFAEEALMEAYNQATSQGASKVLLNFSGLSYMNSSGIGLLVTLLIRVQRNKHKLAAYGLSDHYRQIFELTRLNEAITIYESELAALAA